MRCCMRIHMRMFQLCSFITLKNVQLASLYFGIFNKGKTKQDAAIYSMWTLTYTGHYKSHI